MKTKIISLLLAIFLISAMLVACGGHEESSGVSESVSGGSEFQNEKGEYVADTGGRRYDGETITFLTCGEGPVYESEILPNIETYESGALQTYPQIINDDLKRRAEILETELGVTLEEIQLYSPNWKNGEMCQTILRDALASSEDYQVVVPCLYDGATLAVEDVLYNLLSLENLQIDAPWWNQDFNKSMTYAGQLYFSIGDIGLVNKANTASLFFNYELWNKNGLTEKYGGNPYELVRAGKWTHDLVFEAARSMGKDITNDGKVDYSDEYGWSGQFDDMWAIFFGSGEKIASADAPMATLRLRMPFSLPLSALPSTTYTYAPSIPFANTPMNATSWLSVIRSPSTFGMANARR